MIEIKKKWDNVLLINEDKKEVEFFAEESKVLLDTMDVNHPWEYEKSWILLEVKDYMWTLFYNFSTNGKTIVYIFETNFELKEEIMSFFWDVDILIIKGSKESAKVFENIEARVVVPFWEWAGLFLSTLGQHSEAVKSHKIKSDMWIDDTVFVNLG